MPKAATNFKKLEELRLKDFYSNAGLSEAKYCQYFGIDKDELSVCIGAFKKMLRLHLATNSGIKAIASRTTNSPLFVAKFSDIPEVVEALKIFRAKRQAQLFHLVAKAPAVDRYTPTLFTPFTPELKPVADLALYEKRLKLQICETLLQYDGIEEVFSILTKFPKTLLVEDSILLNTFIKNIIRSIDKPKTAKLARELLKFVLTHLDVTHAQFLPHEIHALAVPKVETELLGLDENDKASGDLLRELGLEHEAVLPNIFKRSTEVQSTTFLDNFPLNELDTVDPALPAPGL